MRVVITHVGKPINAINCKDAQFRVTKIIKIIFYFTFKQFLSRSLISYVLIIWDSFLPFISDILYCVVI